MEIDERILRGLEKYQAKMVGQELTPPLANEVVTKDAIRHFAAGTGDLNPLWIDEAYAAATPYGRLIAPPLFLNAISEGQAIVGLPGLVTTFVGAEWEFARLVKVGDRFRVTNRLLPLEDKAEAGGKPRWLQSGVISYLNQDGVAAGRCAWRALRTPVGLAGGGKAPSTHEPRPRTNPVEPHPHRYTEAELAAIYAAVEAEEVRGGRPRYWEEVAEGEALTPVVKGPLSLADMVAFAQGINWFRLELAFGAKLRYLKENRGLSYLDPETNTPEPIGLSHFHGPAAKALMGSPLAIDIGFQRICWLGHLVTNWLGDLGFLLRLSARIKGFVRFGETNWVKGKVGRKFQAEGGPLVELELWAENQEGQVTMTGQAVATLPVRDREFQPRW